MTDASNDQAAEQLRSIDHKVGNMLERIQSLSWRLTAVESHSELLRVIDKERAAEIEILKAQIASIEKRLDTPDG